MGLRSWLSGSSGSSSKSSSSSDSPPSYSSLFGSGKGSSSSSDSKSSSDKPPSYDSLFGSGSNSNSNSGSSSSSSNRYPGSSSNSNRGSNNNWGSNSNNRNSDSDMSGLGFLFAGSALTGSDRSNDNRRYTSAAIRTSAVPPKAIVVMRGVKAGICLTAFLLVFLMVFFGLVTAVIKCVSTKRRNSQRKIELAHELKSDHKVVVTDISFPENVHLKNGSSNFDGKRITNESDISVNNKYIFDI